MLRLEDRWIWDFRLAQTGGQRGLQVLIEVVRARIMSA
jgi:hypothetical protein